MLRPLFSFCCTSTSHPVFPSNLASRIFSEIRTIPALTAFSRVSVKRGFATWPMRNMASNRELAAKVPADPKRIVVACDGTWDDSDYGMKRNLPWEKETAVPPSNVTRICRSIKKFDEVHKKQQIVYYQAGIGSEHTLKDKFWGGLTGFGISEHVREAYAFLAHNYVEGDEIILLGFSRGAFTARTIGAMVADLGILSMKGMSYFFPIFKDWENKILPGYVSPFQEPFPADVQKPSVGASGEPYQNFLVDVSVANL